MSRVTDTIDAARILTAGGVVLSTAQIADALAAASERGFPRIPEPDVSPFRTPEAEALYFSIVNPRHSQNEGMKQ